MGDRRLWTAQEDQVILRLIEQLGTAQWTAIANEMRSLLPYPRTSKQIRQRWYNQLSPCITKSVWTTEEENILFASHSKLGNRWKDIARALPGRTDNSVKNHFYSTVRRALRRLDKHFGFRDSTKKMRSLKPASLTLLLETARNLPDYAEMMALLLQFAQWKPSKSTREIQPHYGRELYQNIIEMINNFNKNYRRTTKDKQGRKRQVEVKSEQNSCEQIQHTDNSYDHLHGDNLSTISDGQDEDSVMSNYFGSVAQTKSWFNVNERQWGAKVCQEQLRILCDEDQFQ